MYEAGVGSFFFALACLLKLAVLQYVGDDECLGHCPRDNYTNMNSSLQKEEVNISDDIRQRHLPELFPLSNQSVQYFCAVQQNRTYEVKNFPLKEKSGPYCNVSSSAESLRKTLGDPVIITIPDLYNTSNYFTSWYKDCKEYVKNTSEVSFTSVQQSDSAVYTYIITHMYNGEHYSVCGKIWLIVTAQKKEKLMNNRIARLKRQSRSSKGHRENIMPRILGIGNKTIVEVEIGKNNSIKCEASITKTDQKNAYLYWVRTNRSNIDNPDDILDPCTSTMSKTCTGKIESTNSTQSTDLYLINISDDDIKYPYICKLDSFKGGDMRLFELKLKDKSQDLSKNVFTKSIIASIICSVLIVFLIFLCIMFRMQIVLLYRSLTGVDETIGDGKEYDAYLSFESSSSCESDERHFVYQTLAPILEDRFGYKLCIFERDVVPGGAQVDDMNSFLEKSRRLIIVLCNDFTSCKAMYELESGLHKAMVERKIKVILIESTPLSEQSFQIESLQLLKMKNRVKWKGDKSRPLNSQFWKQIQYLMPAKPIKSSSRFSTLKAI
ncbi:interleukin-18 receptor 1 [Bufo gargarizans]|uniref:interleukin-18 receptor 1 n=1 Tax=Bufo gargarizans TaxID=30331 RepID=UPI001CF14E07|nr:interleukin-18 receptor 1 [Bufo gargarizans]